MAAPTPVTMAMPREPTKDCSGNAAATVRCTFMPVS